MSNTVGDPPPVDARYAEALRRQKDERKQMSQRRRPILRVVGGTETEDSARLKRIEELLQRELNRHPKRDNMEWNPATNSYEWNGEPPECGMW